MAWRPWTSRVHACCHGSSVSGEQSSEVLERQLHSGYRRQQLTSTISQPASADCTAPKTTEIWNILQILKPQVAYYEFSLCVGCGLVWMNFGIFGFLNSFNFIFIPIWYPQNITVCSNQPTQWLLIDDLSLFTKFALDKNTHSPSRSSKVIDFGTIRKRVCDFLLICHTNLAHLSCFVSKILQVFSQKNYPTLFHPNFGEWGCSRWTRSSMLGQVWVRTLSATVLQSTCSQYLNVTVCV